MIYIVIFVLLAIFVWMSYEFHRAPFIDRNGNIIKKKKNDSSAESNDTYREIF
jgi:hypothetical protein